MRFVTGTNPTFATFGLLALAISVKVDPADATDKRCCYSDCTGNDDYQIPGRGKRNWFLRASPGMCTMSSLWPKPKGFDSSLTDRCELFQKWNEAYGSFEDELTATEMTACIFDHGDGNLKGKTWRNQVDLKLENGYDVEKAMQVDYYLIYDLWYVVELFRTESGKPENFTVHICKDGDEDCAHRIGTYNFATIVGGSNHKCAHPDQEFSCTHGNENEGDLIPWRHRY